jgi:hypothetical protein
MRKANCEPAYSIIRKLGGDSHVAQICGLQDRTSPYRWTRPRSLKGSDGLVPSKYVPVLLSYAKRKGIKLSAQDFVPSE